MIGLVLCGGESSRMGSDKGLLTFDGDLWAELAYNKMEKLKIPVLVSVNEKQLPIYAKQFPQWNFVTDNIALKVRGPLLGLLSAHLQFPEEDFIILATDMIYLASSTLEALTESFHEKNSDAVIFTSENRLQPLCGVYSAKLLKKIYTIYLGGKLERFSMQYVLQFGFIEQLQIPKNKELEFRNLNSKDDL